MYNLYNQIITELPNDVLAAAAAMKTSSLPLPLSSSNNNSQKLNYENDNTVQAEEAKYNNHPVIHKNPKEQANE